MHMGRGGMVCVIVSGGLSHDYCGTPSTPVSYCLPLYHLATIIAVFMHMRAAYCQYLLKK